MAKRVKVNMQIAMHQVLHASPQNKAIYDSLTQFDLKSQTESENNDKEADERELKWIAAQMKELKQRKAEIEQQMKDRRQCQRQRKEAQTNSLQKLKIFFKDEMEKGNPNFDSEQVKECLKRHIESSKGDVQQLLPSLQKLEEQVQADNEHNVKSAKKPSAVELQTKHGVEISSKWSGNYTQGTVTSWPLQQNLQDQNFLCYYETFSPQWQLYCSAETSWAKRTFDTCLTYMDNEPQCCVSLAGLDEDSTQKKLETYDSQVDRPKGLCMGSDPSCNYSRDFESEYEIGILIEALLELLPTAPKDSTLDQLLRLFARELNDIFDDKASHTTIEESEEESCRSADEYILLLIGARIDNLNVFGTDLYDTPYVAYMELDRENSSEHDDVSIVKLPEGMVRQPETKNMTQFRQTLIPQKRLETENVESDQDYMHTQFHALCPVSPATVQFTTDHHADYTVLHKAALERKLKLVGSARPHSRAHMRFASLMWHQYLCTNKQDYETFYLLYVLPSRMSALQILKLYTYLHEDPEDNFLDDSDPEEEKPQGLTDNTDHHEYSQAQIETEAREIAEKLTQTSKPPMIKLLMEMQKNEKMQKFMYIPQDKKSVEMWKTSDTDSTVQNQVDDSDSETDSDDLSTDGEQVDELSDVVMSDKQEKAIIEAHSQLQAEQDRIPRHSPDIKSIEEVNDDYRQNAEKGIHYPQIKSNSKRKREEEPAAIEEEPAAIEEEPAAIEEEPAAIEEKPVKRKFRKIILKQDLSSFKTKYTGYF